MASFVRLLTKPPKGEVRIALDKEEIIVKNDESYLVDGSIPHAVWNNKEAQTKELGINVIRQN